MKIRTIGFRTGLSFLRIIPISESILRWSIRFLLALSIRRDTEDTLRSLFRINDDLSIIIDMIAIQYGKGIHVKHRLMDYSRFFTERVKCGEKVLDIGCGDGHLAYQIATYSKAHITAIDISEKKVIDCEKRFKHARLKFMRMDANNCCLGETFDIIVLSNVLEHIQERVTFLKKITLDLKPAKILIRVPMFNRSWYVPLRKELGLPYYSDETHYTEYTLKSFKKEMSEAELSIDHYQINWGEIWAEIGVRGVRNECCP